MIYAKKNITNKICLTLTESASISNPFFLFFFESEFNKDLTFTFTLTDISDYPERYNLFEFEPDEDMPTGQYSYKVYESEMEITDPADGIFIEEGRMVIELEGQQTTIYD